jgi:hypothetical protein
MNEVAVDELWMAVLPFLLEEIGGIDKRVRFSRGGRLAKRQSFA